MTEALHEAVQKKMNLTDEQWGDIGQADDRTSHNEEDVVKAKAFAKGVLG